MLAASGYFFLFCFAAGTSVLSAEQCEQTLQKWRFAYGQSIPSGFLLTRVNSNICICFTSLVWRCTDGYLVDHLILASDAAPRCRHLRSANLNRLTACASLSTQHVRYGCRVFHYAGPTVWNSLPDELRKADSFDSFKTVLENVSLIR